MKLQVWLAAGAALIACAGPVAGRTRSDTAKPAAAAEKGPAAAEAAAMEAYMKLNAPGEPHRMLAGLAGEWALEVKSWTAPGAPPSVSQATCVNKLVMGGRFVQEDVTGTMMDTPFAGMSLTGYDNIKKKYVGIWVDSMTTGIFRSEGDYDASTKAMTFTGTSFDPMAGKDVQVRTVTRFESPGRHVFEWYAPGPDGKEMKSMEITYTRQK